jgi:putative ABC transport system ATP-binding protein
MIRLSAITRVFHMGDQEVRALNNINLDIASGEYVSIMGPSGSGKSTLLNVIGLLDRPTTDATGWGIITTYRTRQAQVRRNKVGFVFRRFPGARLTAAGA